MSPSTVQDHIEALVSEIEIRAEQAHWALARDESLEAIVVLHSDTLLQALGGSEPVELHQLPESRRAIILRDSARLLIAGSDGEGSLLEFCQKALWWAGIVRGSLQPIHRADLHLFIVAMSSDGDGLLRDRSRIEADERICRKHVWLPSFDISVGEFLDTTLLARPWQSDASTPHSLDPIHRLGERAGLPPHLATAWMAALSEMDGTRTDDMAEVLIKLYEETDVE